MSCKRRRKSCAVQGRVYIYYVVFRIIKRMFLIIILLIFFFEEEKQNSSPIYCCPHVGKKLVLFNNNNKAAKEPRCADHRNSFCCHFFLYFNRIYLRVMVLFCPCLCARPARVPALARKCDSTQQPDTTAIIQKIKKQYNKKS